ncbi:MAG: 50S ribosomal protein L1 [Myxococcales bacterium]|nr:50S ribosomal protein L1 [Myxococcales bacterium]
MSQRGKKHRAAVAKVDRTALYDLASAVTLAKNVSYAKFEESVDIAVKLGVNPRHADQMVRGACVLPHGTGKTARVVVFAKGEKAKEAEDAGADRVGGDDLVEDIKNGWLEFDKAIATPDMMGAVGKIGRVLGPRGLMPNPKVGTVTFDVGNAVKEAKAGKIEFRTEKAGIVHSTIGKKSFSANALEENARALIDTLIRLKPATAKGRYVRGVAVSTTMGPGVKVDPVQVAELP